MVGVVWAHFLPSGLKEDLGAKLAPVLGLLGALLEKVLDAVITAWDWLRSKLGGAPGGRRERWGACGRAGAGRASGQVAIWAAAISAWGLGAPRTTWGPALHIISLAAGQVL